MLLPALVLVTVEREHDRLEQGVDLRQRDQAAEGGNVARLGLEEEEEVRVLLHLPFVGVVTILGISLFKMLLELILLGKMVRTGHIDKSNGLLRPCPFDCG
jgi:hypothetical protein